MKREDQRSPDYAANRARQRKEDEMPGVSDWGMPEGARIWEGIEARREDLLQLQAQKQLMAHLAKQFG
jgi:hypothetical protein